MPSRMYCHEKRRELFEDAFFVQNRYNIFRINRKGARPLKNNPAQLKNLEKGAPYRFTSETAGTAARKGNARSQASRRRYRTMVQLAKAIAEAAEVLRGPDRSPGSLSRVRHRPLYRSPPVRPHHQDNVLHQHPDPLRCRVRGWHRRVEGINVSFNRTLIAKEPNEMGLSRRGGAV